jgi:hypothetical protein
MNREVTREKKLPVFSIVLGDLDALVSRLINLFEDQEKTRVSIDIKLKNEKLEFENIKELCEYKELPSKVTQFSLYISGGGNRVSISADSIFNPLAIVRATANNEAWCAGAIETVFSFISSYKRWYHFFVAAPIGWFLFILGNIPAIVLFTPISNFLSFNTLGTIGYFLPLIVLAILYFFRPKLFPARVIVINENETFIRKYSAELSLAIASISVIISIIGLYLNK